MKGQLTNEVLALEERGAWFGWVVRLLNIQQKAMWFTISTAASPYFEKEEEEVESVCVRKCGTATLNVPTVLRRIVLVCFVLNKMHKTQHGANSTVSINIRGVKHDCANYIFLTKTLTLAAALFR
jgi:hypothetical protein